MNEIANVTNIQLLAMMLACWWIGYTTPYPKRKRKLKRIIKQEN